MSVFNLYLWLFLLKTSLINRLHTMKLERYHVERKGNGWREWEVPLSSRYFGGVRKCRYPAATLWKWESAAIQLLLCGSEKVPLSSCYFVGVRKCRYPAATLWKWESAAIQLLLCGREKVPLSGSPRGHTVTLVSKISLESYLVTLQQFFHKHKTVC